MELTHFGGQSRLITYGAGHTAKKGGHFGTGLGKAEDIINKQQCVLARGIPEPFGHGERCKCHAKAGTGGLIHLAEDHCRLGNNRTIGFPDFGFLHFQPKVITFTSSFTDPSKNRITTMLAGNSGDKFGEDNGFTKTRTAEQACFATTNQRGQEVNNLNTRLKDLDLGR